MSGGTKADSGKAPINYIPSEYVIGTAQVFQFGAKKYAAHNYRLGLAHSRLIDATMRHLLAILAGEEIDPESGFPHIYHASCSLAMYDYQRLHHPSLNDIFELTKGNKDEEANSDGDRESRQPEFQSFSGLSSAQTTDVLRRIGSISPSEPCSDPNCPICNPPARG